MPRIRRLDGQRLMGVRGMEIAHIDQMTACVQAWQSSKQRIAFVPTMGNLHAGHLALVRHARTLADVVVVSVYVNPLQFGPQEDYAAYPRTPEQDRALLVEAGADIVFRPDDTDIYPRGREAQTIIEVPGLSEILCGAHRPGHFRGVATVVARLFGLVNPQVAVFGKKDYQQWLIIRRMVADLCLPVGVAGCETVREADGLAMSSRNSYLGAEERAIAPQLVAALRAAVAAMQSGTAVAEAERAARVRLDACGFRCDYVSVRRQSDLGVPDAGRNGDTALVILAAAWLGRTRLIDNLEFERA